MLAEICPPDILHQIMYKAYQYDGVHHSTATQHEAVFS